MNNGNSLVLWLQKQGSLRMWYRCLATAFLLWYPMIEDRRTRECVGQREDGEKLAFDQELTSEKK